MPPRKTVAPDLDPSPTGNTPELSVSELANALKRTVEDRFGLVRVRGEISNYRGPHSSGHAYFSLKDFQRPPRRGDLERRLLAAENQA